MDDGGLRDWLIDLAVKWIKIVLTIVCVTVLMFCPFFFGLGVLVLAGPSEEKEVVKAIACVIFALIAFPVSILIIFRIWAGYTPFYSRWKIRRALKKQNFFTPKV